VLRGIDGGGVRMSVSAQRQAGSLDAAVVWEDFHERLLAFIARRVPDRGSAEDILQDVMLRIHRHAADLERSAAVGAWVHRIARNAIVDYYRRAAVRRERPSGIDLDREETPAADTTSAELRSELAACLGPLLQQLPEIHAEALRLTEFEGLAQADAAARLGVSTSGMKSRVQRARAQLGGLLAACCQIELDRRGAITSYHPRRTPCDCRGAPPR
jgi:RNA polymerase sigma-70 factor, ECF subfamily